MTNIKSLLITLDDPVKICLSEEGLPSSNLIITDQVLSPPRFPRWSTCADLLVNSRQKELVGLTYPVTAEAKELVEYLSATLSNRVVRYVQLPSDRAATIRYSRHEMTQEHFEVKWSLTEADYLEVAQLDSDYWYYDDMSGEEGKLKAIGLNYIDELLFDYKLKLPNNIQFEPFKPKFIHIT